MVGCQTKDTSPKIKFSGVTQTDKFGTVVGKADSSDWRLDDKWVDKEKALFNATYNDGGSLPENLSVVFFANPCRGQSVLYIKKDTTVRLSVRLVDKEFNVLFSKDSIYDNKLLLDLNSLAMNDTVRLYYKFIDDKNNEFKGHGDIHLWLK
jgi:hypothetical protein